MHYQIYKPRVKSNPLNNQILTTSSSIKLHATRLKPGLKKHIRAPEELRSRDKRMCNYV